MNFELSAREKELSRKGREFCDQVLLPLEMITDEHGELPMDRREAVRQAVRDWGLAGINHAKENGGLGLTMVEQTAIEEQLGRVTNGLWSCVWRPPVSLKFGTPGAEGRIPDPVLARVIVAAAFAITEQDAGSDPRRVKTGAHVPRTASGTSPARSGSSRPTTPRDFIIVHAHVDDDPEQADPVPGRQAGRTTWCICARRSSCITSPSTMPSLRFDDVVVGEDKMLGEIGQGLDLTKDWFVEARLQIASHAVGAATRAAEIANDYATTRHQFDRPIRDFQGIEFMLADMAVDIFAAKSMLYRVAWEIDKASTASRSMPMPVP